MTLVPLDRAACPDCGSSLHRIVFTQLPFISGGGYGACRQTVDDRCPCGWRIERSVGEVSPRG